MVNFKQVLLIFLLLSVFQGANAQTTGPEGSCYENAEGEYAYHTELLMHVYETARVSPKEFETLRQKLIHHREASLESCEKQYNAEMDKMMENIQLTTVVHEPNLRGIASILPSEGERLPASTDSTYTRGAYTEVGPASVTVDYEGEIIPEYNGERTRIDN